MLWLRVCDDVGKFWSDNGFCIGPVTVNAHISFLSLVPQVSHPHLAYLLSPAMSPSDFVSQLRQLSGSPRALLQSRSPNALPLQSVTHHDGIFPAGDAHVPG